MAYTRVCDEVNSLFASIEHREMIHEFIASFKNGIISDPAEQFRPMIRADTSTNYDGNKVELL
jgi:hypothetical protein